MPILVGLVNIFYDGGDPLLKPGADARAGLIEHFRDVYTLNSYLCLHFICISAISTLLLV